MPRYQPPKDYYTSTQVKQILNISGAMIANYVEKGKIKHIIPPGRKQGFYLKKDVDRLANEISAFFSLEEEADNTSFTVVSAEDVPNCILLNKELFHEIEDDDNTLLSEKWTKWIQKNPEVVYVLKRDQDVIGIFAMLPFQPNSEKLKEVLSADTSILLGDVDITAEDLQEYNAGIRVQLYFAEIGIKPSLDKTLRRKYGARLISKSIDVVVNLGSKGVVIENIVAVGASKSGVRLLQHFGFSEMVFHRSDTRMFELDMMKSGAPVAVNYRKALKESNPNL
jgi:hypothetical protein